MVINVSSATKLSKRRLFCEEAHLSFSGGGFLGIYHVGVALAFRDFAPHIASRKVLGTSSGALAATCLASGFPIEKAINNIVRMAVHTRSLPLGPLHPRFNICDMIREDLDLYMPADAHIRSSGRLFVSVTRASTLQNQLISQFDTREELIDVLLASCFIPYFLGWLPPKVKNVRYIDGGVSVNMPIHDEHTITVAPFPGISRIGPRDGVLPRVAFAPDSLYRLCKTMVAPPPATLEKLIQQGYRDAIDFLQKNEMLSCQSCIAGEKYLLMSSALEFGTDERELRRLPDSDDKICEACYEQIALSDASKVPRSLLKTLDYAAMVEMKDQQLKPHRYTKIARMLALVMAITMLPLDVGLATLRKATDNWETLWCYVLDGYNNLIIFLKKIPCGSQKKGFQLCGTAGSKSSSNEGPNASPSLRTSPEHDSFNSDNAAFKAVPHLSHQLCNDCHRDVHKNM